MDFLGAIEGGISDIFGGGGGSGGGNIFSDILGMIGGGGGGSSQSGGDSTLGDIAKIAGDVLPLLALL